MDTGHIDIGTDEIKNIRTDVTLDDGTAVTIANGTEYGIQNVGDSEVSLTEREMSRGIPSLNSEDAHVIPPRGWLYMQVVSGMDYFVWSLNRESRVIVSRYNGTS